MGFAQRATEARGTAHRVNRNMVVFLAADEDRMAELDTAVRDYLGWSDVLAKQDELDLTQNQKNQALDKQRQADDTVKARLLGTYQWALVPDGQPVTIRATKVEGQSTSLAERVSKRLGNDGTLTTQQAAAAIRHQLNTTAKPLWATGHVSVGDLWKLYAAYAYMPRLRDRAALNAGLRNAPLLWEQDGFALAEGYDEQAGRYRGLVLPSDQTSLAITDSTLVVQPALAVERRARETAAATAAPGGETRVTSGQAPAGPATTAPAPPNPVGKSRFFETKELSPGRLRQELQEDHRRSPHPPGRHPDVELRVTLEIEANTATGFDDNRVRTLSENARTLKFEQSGFEET